MRAIIRWGILDRLAGRRRVLPPGPAAPRVDSIPVPDGQDADGAWLTWIGHASFLGSLAGARYLVDPVFSERAGRLYRRYAAPGLRPGDLPPLDALLVTHSHYDHLDRRSVLALSRDLAVCVPLGLGRWFRRRGFSRVTELNWWESADRGPLRITLVPARHWSRRRLGDTNKTLWGGFVVEAAGRKVYHAGDTAWFDGFKEIGRRFPDLLAALLPVGAYDPAWFMENQHLNPEQAGRAFLELGARRLVPMHWGTFRLADEPLVEPVERLRRWWDRHGPDDVRRLCVPRIGETLLLQD